MQSFRQKCVRLFSAESSKHNLLTHHPRQASQASVSKSRMASSVLWLPEGHRIIHLQFEMVNFKAIPLKKLNQIMIDLNFLELFRMTVQCLRTKHCIMLQNPSQSASFSCMIIILSFTPKNFFRLNSTSGSSQRTLLSQISVLFTSLTASTSPHLFHALLLCVIPFAKITVPAYRNLPGYSTLGKLQ